MLVALPIQQNNCEGESARRAFFDVASPRHEVHCSAALNPALYSFTYASDCLSWCCSVSVLQVLAMASWAYFNPGYSLMLFDDADIRAFMTTYYPDLLATFDGLGSPVERTDLWRYLVLCRLGGVYADSDVMAARPISQWAQDAGLLVGIENVFTTPEEARQRSYSRQVRGGVGCGCWCGMQCVSQLRRSVLASRCMHAHNRGSSAVPWPCHLMRPPACLPAFLRAVSMHAGPDGAVVDRVPPRAPRGVPHGAVRGQARGGGACWGVSGPRPQPRHPGAHRARHLE